MSSAEQFYDDLSAEYHLIATGWDETVRNQGKILSSFLNRLDPQKSIYNILDCSCGIGTQAIGLALEGHFVTASDISSKAVERAKTEASRFNVDIKLFVSDFRTLKNDFHSPFEMVVSCDNSLPHLLTESDLDLAAQNIFQCVAKDGYIAISMRDYDQIRKDGIQGMVPRKISDKNGTRIYFQTWDWNEHGTIYDLELFILKRGEMGWISKSHSTQYRAWLRTEISEALTKAGFSDIQWWTPDQTGYYQPIVTGRRSI